jgi:hypothetical protein
LQEKLEQELHPKGRVVIKTTRPKVLFNHMADQIARSAASPTDSMSWPAPLTVLQAAAKSDADNKMIVAILRMWISDVATVLIVLHRKRWTSPEVPYV